MNEINNDVFKINDISDATYEDYFEFYQNDAKITIYGGVITKFEF